MKQEEQHIIHTSLTDEATIGGVSRGVFGLEFVFSILMFNYFRVSIMTAILIGLICFVVHPVLRKMHKEDPLSLQFLLMSFFSSQSYYPSQPDINSKSDKPKSSIPKIK